MNLLGEPTFLQRNLCGAHGNKRRCSSPIFLPYITEEESSNLQVNETLIDSIYNGGLDNHDFSAEDLDFYLPVPEDNVARDPKKQAGQGKTQQDAKPKEDPVPAQYQNIPMPTFIDMRDLEIVIGDTRIDSERWAGLDYNEREILRAGNHLLEQLEEEHEEVRKASGPKKHVNRLSKEKRLALVNKSEAGRIWHAVGGSTTGVIAPFQIFIREYKSHGISPGFLWLFARCLLEKGSEKYIPWSFLMEGHNSTCDLCRHLQKPHYGPGCQHEAHLQAIWGRLTTAPK